MNNNIKNNKGFGLLEVLVSISVVIIGILPMINLFNSVLTRERNMENKLKAIYFAQEGIEIVRQIRDTNWRKGDAWDFRPPTVGDTVYGTWGVSLNNCGDLEGGFKLISSTSQANRTIYYKSGKPYAQGCTSGGRQATGFERTVLIENQNYAGAFDANYLKITSVVKLDGADLYSLISYLNKWQ